MIEKINSLLNGKNFDIRISGDARFMDQKVTPDVLCIIADCVVNFNAKYSGKPFTKDDIWELEYFNTSVKSIFNKPDAQNQTSSSEYDKFTSQPLRTLAYSGVLNMSKKGNKNIYTINHLDILEFVSFKERNSYQFLCLYLKKVLSDSSFLKHFEEIKQKFDKGILNDNDFQELKIKFQRFIIGNTPINGTTEVNRIFPKIFNIYACENFIPGTIKGRLSKNVFYYTDLMYNRPNWRDVVKSKNVSRQESMQEHEDLLVHQNKAYSEYLITKMVNVVRKLHKESEVKDQFSSGEATQVHHIFPKSTFPNLAHYIENMIKLTATQHYTKAHPGNNTKRVDLDYQCVCLMAKSQSIESHINGGGLDYRKESFIHVINSGLKKSLSSTLNFRDIRLEISRIYNQL